MVLLGGVGEALILKYIGGKLTTLLAGHLAANPVLATNVAMHATSAAMSSAASATTTAGAVASLGHSAYLGGKFALKVENEREKLRRQKAPINIESNDEVVSFMLLAAMGMIAEGHYQSLENRDAAGDLKTSLEEITPCALLSCQCMDFDGLTGSTCRNCGHGDDVHRGVELGDMEVVMASLWLSLAQQFYPLMQRRDGEGNFKTQLTEIDTCVFADCPCIDFDLDEGQQFFSRRCSCGHRFREHAVTGQWDWIVVGLAQVALELWANEE